MQEPYEPYDPEDDTAPVQYPDSGPINDDDLMPDTNAPISTTKRAFGESGHRFSVRKGKEGQ